LPDKPLDSRQPSVRFQSGIPIFLRPEEQEQAVRDDREKAARGEEKMEERDYKGRQIAIQSGTLKTQVALVIFGIIGAAISAYQAHTAHISAGQAVRASDSEVAANRAWIVPDTPPIKKHSIGEANLEWHNAGKTPAIAVFNAREYFSGEFPRHVHSCVELEQKLKKQSVDTWQYQPFVSENGRYEIGNDHVPAWVGQQPILIHGCIWYTDILSNTEKSTEFFLTAIQGKYTYPQFEGVTLFYLADRPFVYR
jgi:hypothetical protein